VLHRAVQLDRGGQGDAQHGSSRVRESASSAAGHRCSNQHRHRVAPSCNL
jgi:hypothetical protein